MIRILLVLLIVYLSSNANAGCGELKLPAGQTWAQYQYESSGVVAIVEITSVEQLPYDGGTRYHSILKLKPVEIFKGEMPDLLTYNLKGIGGELARLREGTKHLVFLDIRRDQKNNQYSSNTMCSVPFVQLKDAKQMIREVKKLKKRAEPSR